MNKVCVFLGEGFEEIEALTVVDLLRRVEIETEMISITGEMTVQGSHNILIAVDKLFEDVEFDKVDMIVLPGGMPGTKNLEAHEPLMRQLDAFYETGKCISAICAAPSILGHRGMLKGRAACSYSDFESHLEGALLSRKPVEVSDHIITSRGMGTAIEFGLAIVERFKGAEVARKLAEAILYV